ncbi:beta-galactosidase GalB [Hymenobacter jeollabukensis]|uniref:Glycoside hydrolase family 2 protein n=1 Tax=Hymenobacter jeollabukensis TaxID=2025313 RepID=A0A5R8WKJ1_9BACT|nr:beta-galactosidase GalB [Hymenobacter jeollabukensis]TLM89073.1 glycoside hydrolase family 2 protein [Hymenobacter jeollabukensis]
MNDFITRTTLRGTLASLLLLPAGAAWAQQTRQEVLLTTDWKFTKGDVPAAAQPAFKDAKWQTVQVPHDWAIYGPFSPQNDLQTVKIEQNNEKEAKTKAGRTGGLPFIGTGWYRRKLAVPGFATGKRAVLLFDGAMSDAHVFVNGREMGAWPYGYNSFAVDITDAVRPGGQDNVLAVRLQNLPEQSRWYPGAGLYRNVHLLITNDVHIPVWGTYLTTPTVTADYAKVKLRTKVETPGNAFQALRLDTDIRDAAGKVVATVSTPLTATDGLEFEQNLVVPRPQLWSPETPTLYSATSKLYAGDVLKDEYQTSFGIRSIGVEAGRGFVLNGQPRKFRGVCNHHDLGPLGAAVNTAALRRQLVLLKDLGCDAIRTTHNMPAPELVQLCDEMGFMLMVEPFDEWKTPKVKNGYSRLFDEWAEKDIVSMVRHYRNNPSVVMWSIGNEVPDQWAPGGSKLAKRLQDIVHREDPTRPVTAGMDQFDAAVNNGFAALLDVPGFNYKPHRYPEAYTKLPQGMILGTETASTVSSRGVYKFPVEKAKDKRYPDNQSSSYDLEASNWSQTPDEEFAAQDDLPYTLGEFVWTGFDYLGEPWPYDESWPSHSSYFGILDLAGLPKDRFYLYRARWNPAQPTLHLLPHWTWPGREGQTTPVFAYTNYPSAELFVNGVSQGRQTKGTSDQPQTRYRLMWNDVKYQPGSLKVVAYDAAGKAVAEEEVRTAGQPHHLKLVADRTKLAADGQDLAFVTVRVEDAQGNLCPDATPELQFQVKGAGRFRAAANGDPTNLEPFHQPRMHAFHGQLVAVVQAHDKAGNVQLQVSSKGLPGATLQLQTQ